MLFDSQTLSAVLNSFYKSAEQFIDDFDETIEKLHDYYDGNQIKNASDEYYFEQNEGEPLAKFEERARFFVILNITKDIIDRLCLNYIQPPKREIWLGDDREKSDILCEQVVKLWNTPGFNDSMDIADRESVLSGGIFGRVQWNPESKNIEVKWFPYNHIWLAGTEKIEVLKTYYTITDAFTGDVWVDSWVYTDDIISHYKNGEWVEQPDNPNDENPYGCIPFIHLRSGQTLNQIWGVGIGVELVDANKQINDALSDVRYKDKIQSYKQLIFRDCETPGTVGMLAPIKVRSAPGSEKQASVSTLDLNAPTQKGMDNLIKYVSSIYARFGLGSKSILNYSQSAPQSGVAKNLSNIELAQFTARQQQRLKQAEIDIAQLAVKIAGYHLGVTPAKDYNVDINFMDFIPPMTATEKTAKQQWLESIGAVTPVDIMAEELDISQEEARERYINNKVQESVIKQEISKRITQEMGL